MKNADAYVFVFIVTMLLAAPIIQAIQTLLAMRARIIFPLLRRETGQHYSTLVVTPHVIVCPHCASSIDRHIDFRHTALIQPREVL
jgi:hypothetical protein